MSSLILGVTLVARRMLFKLDVDLPKTGASWEMMLEGFLEDYVASLHHHLRSLWKLNNPIEFLNAVTIVPQSRERSTSTSTSFARM
jgi:hypothetical protein